MYVTLAGRIFLRTEPESRQLVKAQRPPQLLQRSVQANVGIIVVFRQSAPFLVGGALPKLLVGCFVHQRSLLAVLRLRDAKPCARPSKLRQAIHVEIRSASNERVVVQSNKVAWLVCFRGVASSVDLMLCSAKPTGGA